MFWAALLISWPYTAAMAAGVTEYLMEERFLPQLKQQHVISYVGLALVILGEGIRKLAMVSACQPLLKVQKHACSSGIEAHTHTPTWRLLLPSQRACHSL